MKKILKILVVVCSMLLLAGAFSSCAKKIPTDSAYSKLRDALESSLPVSYTHLTLPTT